MNAVALRPETIQRIQSRMALAELTDADIEETFVRGSGSGGQKINKTSSCVQLKLIPTSTIVRCHKTRSREANRWLARKMLAERLLEARESELSERRQKAEKIRRQKERMLADKSISRRRRRSASQWTTEGSLLLPIGHTLMMRNPAVILNTIAFLRGGPAG